MKIKIKKSKLYGVISIVLAIALVVTLLPNMMPHSMDMKRAEFILLKEDIQNDLMPMGDYRCCLEKPCMYCIEKTPGHGEGATCDCLTDIINGENPCGECIGEIMEGHGNPYLAEYFARAIAEKVGEHHLDSLKEIMFDMYGVAVEEQKSF